MHTPKYNIIVAFDKNKGIGKLNSIPWRLPSDLKRFKDITTKDEVNCVVMGRKTWESIPPKFRPLPNRINIIMTRSDKESISQDQKNIFVCSSFDELDNILDKIIANVQLKEVFFIGGSDIYSGAIKRYPIDRYYLTEVLDNYDCDVFFPNIELSDYKINSTSEQIEKGLSSVFSVYEKNQTK